MTSSSADEIDEGSDSERQIEQTESESSESEPARSDASRFEQAEDDRSTNDISAGGRHESVERIEEPADESRETQGGATSEPPIDPAPIDECVMYLEHFPVLVELDPTLVDWCFDDPETAVDVIVSLASELNALVDECYALLDGYPELVEMDPSLPGWCDSDPSMALATIESLVAEIEAPNAEFHAAMDDCFMYLADDPELLEFEPGLPELCEVDPFAGQGPISELLVELGLF